MPNREGRSFEHQKSSHIRTCWWHPRHAHQWCHITRKPHAHIPTLSLSAGGDKVTNVLSLLLIQLSRIQKLCHLSFNEVPSSPCYVALWYVHLCITVCSKQFLGQASFSFQWLSFLQHLESWGHGFPSVDKFVQTKMKVILLSIVNSQQRFNSIPSLWLIWIQQHCILSYGSCIYGMF